MRTIEEVAADLKAIKAEISQIAAAEAARIAGPYVETMLNDGIDEVHLVFGRRDLATRELELILKQRTISLRLNTKIRDAGGHTIRHHASDFEYNLDNGQWSVAGNVKSAVDALTDWTEIAAAAESERQAERDELAFEAARAAEREDPDYVPPVLDTSGPGLDNIPDPFADA